MPRFNSALSSKERNTLLALLTVSLTLSHLDRHILAIVLDRIGLEFALSDLQLGILSGLSFAVVYALFGFVAARLSVPGWRKPLLAISVGLWSLATMGLGAAVGFFSLLAGRIAVGIGEASVMPNAHAMISDAYPPQRRASAMAVFQAGANIGLFLAFVIGAAVSATWGWRMAFVVAGAPGLLLAAVLMWKLKDPVDRKDMPERPARASLKTSFHLVWSQISARHAFVGTVFSSLVSFGGIAWLPTYLGRVHEMPLPQIGLYLAVVIGVIGAAGTWIGGTLSDRAEARRKGGRMQVVVLTVLMAKSIALTFYIIGPAPGMLVFYAFSVAVNGIFVAPAMSHIYGHVPPQHRPMATAILMFGANFVGLALGPIVVGAISEFSQGRVAAPLGLGLGFLQLFGLWSAWHFWRAGKTQSI